MGDRGGISDVGYLKAEIIQGAHGRFPPRPRPLDEYIKIFHAELLCSRAGLFRRHLGSERSAFSRPAKTRTAGSGPCERIALPVCYRNDGIVKGCMNMRYSVGNILFDPFPYTTRCSHVL